MGFCCYYYCSYLLEHMKKQNDRIFNNTSRIDGCVIKIYMDILLWTDQLPDREQVCLFDDDDNYLQDISPRYQPGGWEGIKGADKRGDQL